MIIEVPIFVSFPDPLRPSPSPVSFIRNEGSGKVGCNLYVSDRTPVSTPEVESIRQ